MVSNKQFTDFQEEIGTLKRLRRTGWVIRGVPMAETVACHSWRMALMAIQKADELRGINADVSHIVEMCLLHDVAESVVGDIIPENHQLSVKKITKEEKHILEADAALTLATKYNFPKLKILFDEYEAQQTLEAKIVRNIDKLDMLLQAYEYMREYPHLTRLEEFMSCNDKDVDSVIFAPHLAEIKSRQYNNEASADLFTDFQIMAGKLKHLERGEFKACNIKDCETVASCDFGAAVMALHLEDRLKEQGFDVQRIVKAIIISDMNKSTTEAHSTYTRQTAEASMVQDLKILEGIQQACEYIKMYPNNVLLKEYVLRHKQEIKSDFVSGILADIKTGPNETAQPTVIPQVITGYGRGGKDERGGR